MYLFISTILYALSCHLTLTYLAYPDGTTAIWPASGIFIATLLSSERGTWRNIIIVFCGVNFALLYISSVIPVLPSLIFSISLALQAFFAAWLLQRCITLPLLFDSFKKVFLFLLLGCLLPATLFAIPLAMTSTFLLNGVFTTTWWWWTISSGIGVLVICPLFLIMHQGYIKSIVHLPYKRIIELMLLFALTILVTRYAFTTNNPAGATLAPYSYLTLPILLLIAIRFNPSSTIVAAFLLTGMALWYDGDAITNRGDSLIALEAFLSIVISSALLVAALVSERLKITAELNIHRDQLESQVNERTLSLKEAYEELESFSYTVSHDLRAPLRAIDGFSKALQEDYKDSLDETAEHFINRITANINRMNCIIDSILSLSRASRSVLNKNKTNLSEISDHIINQLREINPDRNISVMIEKDVYAYGDRHLLTIAMENLLGNAWKYTSKNKHATVEFFTSSIDGKTVYTIKDNGIGFDMKDASKLFHSFERLHTSKDFEGSGIGLSTVTKIISRHKGKIWAEAEMGKGASFYFTLKNQAKDKPDSCEIAEPH